MLQSISLVEIYNTICLLVLKSIIVALNKNSNKDIKLKKKKKSSNLTIYNVFIRKLSKIGFFFK